MIDQPEQMKKAKLSKLLKTKDYSGYPKANLSNSLKTKDRFLAGFFIENEPEYFAENK
jgi:hypothetical protein